MKQRRGLCLTLLAAALLLAGCQKEEVWSYPPALSVACGGKIAQIGAWSANWDGGPEGTAFTACGDTPTSPDVRDSLVEFTAVPGDTLVLSYDLPPKELRVDLTYDMPVEEWSTTLFEGTPASKETVIHLPENCGGVYQVSARWDEGDKGNGGTACGFLVADVSKETPAILEEVPALDLVWNGQTTTVWQGSWTWRVPDGPGSFAETSAAAHGALTALPELPVIPAKAGDEIILAFDRTPDRVGVVVFPVERGEESDVVELEGETILVIPEGGTDTVYEVFAEWTPSLVNGGWGVYGFYVP